MKNHDNTPTSHNIIMKKTAIILSLAIAVLSGCAKKASDVHLVIIGMDGWGSYCMDKADMPNVRSLMEEGAYTLEKRSMLPSHSATNWASMFNGVGAQVHGFTKCCSPKADIEPLYVNEYDIYPNVFRALREQKPDAHIGVVYDWDGLAAVLDTLAFDFRYLSPGGVAGMDDATAKAAAYMKETKPDLMFVYYGETDHVGHTAGHDTPEYYQACSMMDGYVGKVIQAVKDAGMYDNTVFLLTSDHGGVGKGHGGINPLELNTPFILCGKGIAHKGDIGRACVQVDQAPTIAKILGIKLSDDIWGHCIDDFFAK